MKKEYRILVVDDEERICVFLSVALAKMGLDVVTVKSGEEALECFQRELFDIMLTDLRMPGMGGIEVIKRIRESNTDTEIIVLTSHGEVDSYLEAMTLGVLEYLLKPIRIEALKRIITKAISIHVSKMDIE